MQRNNLGRTDRAQEMLPFLFRFGLINWRGIIAGVAISMASAAILISVGLLFGFNSLFESNISQLRDIAPSIGIYFIFTSLISAFIGSYIAARLANAMSAESGLWHGVITWATLLATGMLILALSIPLILGLLSTTGIISGGIPAVTIPLITAANRAIVLDILYFIIEFILLASLLSLTTALLGGWAGSSKISREEMLEIEERYRAERAA